MANKMCQYVDRNVFIRTHLMFTLYRMALASARKLYREGLRSHTRTVISVTEPRGVLPIMAYTGGLYSKGVP